MTPSEKKKLELFAVDVREDIIRSTNAAGSGHPGGSLSAADYFTYIYNEELRIDPQNPKSPNRDRFVLSKVMSHLDFMPRWHIEVIFLLRI